MKQIIITSIIVLSTIQAYSQTWTHTIQEIIEQLPISVNYPYKLYKNPTGNTNNYTFAGKYQISHQEGQIIGANLYRDMQHLQARTMDYDKIEVLTSIKFKTAPTNNSSNLLIFTIRCADDFRRILVSCNNNGDILDFIEIAECEFIESEQIYVIPKQFCLEYEKLTIYQLTPTRTAPWVYTMIKSTDVINAQRKDIVYTIDATTGKFVKSSQTEYYPQDYPISYWGTNGTEIWNGTETKIGTITY